MLSPWSVLHKVSCRSYQQPIDISTTNNICPHLHCDRPNNVKHQNTGWQVQSVGGILWIVIIMVLSDAVDRWRGGGGTCARVPGTTHVTLTLLGNSWPWCWLRHWTYGHSFCPEYCTQPPVKYFHQRHRRCTIGTRKSSYMWRLDRKIFNIDHHFEMRLKYCFDGRRITDIG